MSHRCYDCLCSQKAQYICLCLGSETVWCEVHLKEHFKISKRNHAFDCIYSEIAEWTIDGILKFLSKEKLNKEKLKKIALSVFSKNNLNTKNSMQIKLSELTADLKEISELIKRISQISKKEEVSRLNSLILQPDFEPKRTEDIFLNGLDSIGSLFYRLGQLRKEKIEILNKIKNNPETEEEFRKTCALHEKNASNFLLNQAYKEYIKAYEKITSLYHIYYINNHEVKLFIYDTECERERVKTFAISFGNIDGHKYAIQLPNGELFIYPIQKNFNNYAHGFAFIIDKNYRFQFLSIKRDDFFLTAIYFNRSIYVFGYNKSPNSYPLFTRRFDLDEYRWIELVPIEKYKDLVWRSIIFNRNILITEAYNGNILLYSIDINSFSTIPYEFAKNKEKILISSEDRLYLIERRFGWVYESEAWNEYNWEKISFSEMDFYGEAYCSYNKGAVYISAIDDKNFRQYFKFDLGQKKLIEISCYSDDLALKKVDGKLKAIESYGKVFKLESDYIEKGHTLNIVANQLEKIENENRNIKQYPNNGKYYKEKGDLLHSLEWDNEAIKCYDEAIKLKPIDANAYYSKGVALHKLGKNLEALDCFSRAMELRFYLASYIHLNKGLIFHHLGRNTEAIDCCSEAIKLVPDYISSYWCKAEALHDLGKDNEALEIYDEAIARCVEKGIAYFKKAVFLHNLSRNIEAIECYNEAIKQDPKTFIYFCYRASLLIDLGQEKKAAKDFNRAYSLLSETPNDSYIDYKYFKNCLELLEMLSNMLKITTKVKEEIQKIKDENLNNIEIINGAIEKESIIKEEGSKITKRAVEYLDLNKNHTIEEIREIKNEVSAHQKAMIDIGFQQCLLLSLQE